MPSTLEATKVFLEAPVSLAPGKASNESGDSTSQLEMSQNASMQQWSFADVDAKLKTIMKGIFTNASETAKDFKQPGNLVLGANIAGFRKVADTMISLGVY